jgi:hypothetical protein
VHAGTRLLGGAALVIVGLALASCSASRMASTLADMPQWAGGLPKGAPPRPGTVEYEQWQQQRAQDAARVKDPKGTTP